MSHHVRIKNILNKRYMLIIYRTSKCRMSIMEPSNEQTITEGLATVKTQGHVFYNPVQEFNRDLSIAVLSVFAKERSAPLKENKEKLEKDVSIKITSDQEIKDDRRAGVKCEDGITILEALSASGLRSIRYAKEIPGVKRIIANDLSKDAVQTIRANIELNSVGDIVETSHSDATECMYSHRAKGQQVDAIDLDPYGCPTIFLDSAVQAVRDGGLLLVTATDMAVLAGNSPETCHAKYGSVSLRARFCHEMALRILVRSVEARANAYSRYVEPLLCVSADFYVRAFLRVRYSPRQVKSSTSKLAMVHHCPGCGSWAMQPLGEVKMAGQQPKYTVPVGPPVGPRCEHCGGSHRTGGPVWSGRLHDLEFVHQVLEQAPQHLGTRRRLSGVLSVVLEELEDVPLYHVLEHLAAAVRCGTPPMSSVRSALLNGGHRVSHSHAHRTALKTDAPASFLWEIMRAWEAKHPVRRERLGANSARLLEPRPGAPEVDFTPHPLADAPSRRLGLLRFQQNPAPNWGPGARATNMLTAADPRKKKVRNQNKKRKRDQVSDSSDVVIGNATT